jgi:hypothetical protein
MASTDPRTATQGQWEDLVSKVKAKADSSSLPVISYSTTETNTESTWIDGSDIYKKTFQVELTTMIPDQQALYHIPHGISGLTDVINLEIIAKFTDGSPAVVFWDTITAGLGFEQIDSQEILVYFPYNVPSFDSVVLSLTLYYTKSS